MNVEELKAKKGLCIKKNKIAQQGQLLTAVWRHCWFWEYLEKTPFFPI
ncbi:hypothetical protein NAT50_12220 [Flavobacterium sp. HXWNR70]|uniref:Uncharacterized protein n=1 Tax=Flavobacterium luminosum TaxID=2949086 RepID=A0ABT0TRK7_9FLAO|nr:hypothetical protein [Flavobacterium sp. HXWNR70]